MSSQLRPIPVLAAELLTRVSAPPRLVAHLELVHDVAVQILDRLARDYPKLAVDRAATLFGPWVALLALDDVITEIARGADDRLAHQARYPVA